MKAPEELVSAIEELQLEEKENVPEKIREEHKHALASFLRGERPEAYGHMVPILTHYVERQEPMPLATERLYQTLVMNDLVEELHEREHVKNSPRNLFPKI